MVYALGWDNTDEYSWGYKALDGDIKKAVLSDQTRDGGIGIANNSKTSGRPLIGDLMPTRIEKEGPKRSMPDVALAYGMLLVSGRFREIVERLEPDTHQFFPVDLYWKDGELIGKYYLLNVCNRLNTIDAEHTNLIFDRGIAWKVNSELRKKGVEPQLVFDRSKIEGKHIWREKHFTALNPFMSEELTNTLNTAGISGMALRKHEEV